MVEYYCPMFKYDTDGYCNHYKRQCPFVHINASLDECEYRKEKLGEAWFNPTNTGI